MNATLLADHRKTMLVPPEQSSIHVQPPGRETGHIF
jgi:hypothetical protein